MVSACLRRSRRFGLARDWYMWQPVTCPDVVIVANDYFEGPMQSE